MTALRQALEQYLATRQALGFKLRGYRSRLSDFVAHVDQVGATTITSELALTWATKPQNVHPYTWTVRFLQQVLTSCNYEPRVVITDKLASYVPAVKRVLPRTEHRRHKRLNNRPKTRTCPCVSANGVLQRFKSAEHAQNFLGPFSAVCNHFRPRRHRLTASAYRQIRTERHAVWQEVSLGGAPH